MNNDIYLKYLGKLVEVKIDRPLHSRHPEHGFIYEANYGFVPETLAADGEEIDAYVLGVKKPLATFKGKCIAIIHRLDDDDDKLVVVPEGLVMTKEEIMKLTHFQEQHFQSTVIWRN